MAAKGGEIAYGRLAPHLTEAPLRDLCGSAEGIQTGPFGSQLHQKDYVEIGTPIVTVEHLGENRLRHEDLPRVSTHDRNRLSRYLLREGDIVFSRVGSVDRRALVKSSEDGWMFSGRCIRVRPDPRKIDSRYLSYFFGLPAFKSHIRAIAVGATMPSLNTRLMGDILIPYPSDLGEQRAIAHILGALDDKIDLNRRMAATLEEMARAVFKAWFVDFEPVRAKAEGREIKLPSELARLLPSAFEMTKIGEVPTGWALGSFAHVVDRSTIQDDPRLAPESQYAHYSLPAYDSGQEPVLERGVAIKSTKFRVIDGAILLSKLNPETPRVWWTEVGGDSRPVCSTEFLVLTATSPFSKAYAYCLARTRYLQDRMEGLVTGTSKSHQRAQPNDILAISVVLPPHRLVKAFGDIADPQLRRAQLCRRESRTLADLRDTLLPKLISGELRVKDAERFIGQAV